MGSPESRPLDEPEDLLELLGTAVRTSLDATENSTPAEAVEAVTREFGLALGATGVALLLADLSGRALVRLTEVSLSDATDAETGAVRRDVTESARLLPFDGGPYEQTLVGQAPIVLKPGDAAAGRFRLRPVDRHRSDQRARRHRRAAGDVAA